jgi:hypothetical protein
MFDIEKAIADWHRRMLDAGIRNPEVVDELESHLREDMARHLQSGENAEQAFAAAVERIGQAGLLKREFTKVRGKKWGTIGKLKDFIVSSFAPFPSLDTFTPGARWTLELARQEAPRLQHNFVGTEHVLLGLLALEKGVVPNVLKRMGVNREGLRKQIENWVSIFPSGKMPARLPYTPRVKKSLRLAAREAKCHQQAGVGPEHILLGLMLEGDGVAGRVLKNLGFSSERIRKEIMIELGWNQSAS